MGGNVLLLDEPTNDLDVDTLRALEEALLEFPGCAVVICHDRWFLDRIATHVLAFEGDSEVRVVRGQLLRLRGGPAQAPRRRRRPAAPHQVQAADPLVARLRRGPDAAAGHRGTCAIPLDELEWRFTASGGPGGQHANTSNTQGRGALRHRGLAVARARGSGRGCSSGSARSVRAVASERRSQLQNRELALERLRARLAAALHVDPAARRDASRRARRSKRASSRSGGTASASATGAARRRRRLSDADADAMTSGDVAARARRALIAVVIVLDAAIRTFVAAARRRPCCSPYVVFRIVRSVLQAASPARARSYEARDRVMALYAPLALLAFPTVVAAVVIFVAFALHLRRARARRLARRVHDERLVAAHARVRAAARPRRRCSSRSPKRRSGSRLLALVIAYLPDDLRRVLAARGRW